MINASTSALPTLEFLEQRVVFAIVFSQRLVDVKKSVRYITDILQDKHLY